MTECFDPDVRDYLPDLVHGRLGEVDTATMLAHVEACESCALELALLREVRAAAPVVPRIDVDAIVSALPVVSAPVPSAPARRTFTFLRLAVAAAVVITGALVLNRQSEIMPRLAQAPEQAESASRVSAQVPVADPAASEAMPLSLVSGVQELTDAQIETLLTQLDDIEAIPASEPDQSLNSLESLENTR